MEVSNPFLSLLDSDKQAEINELKQMWKRELFLDGELNKLEAPNLGETIQNYGKQTKSINERQKLMLCFGILLISDSEIALNPSLFSCNL